MVRFESVDWPMITNLSTVGCPLRVNKLLPAAYSEKSVPPPLYKPCHHQIPSPLPKIHLARMFVYGFTGCLGFMMLLRDAPNFLVIALCMLSFAFIGLASWASHCPHCNGYLTFKNNWIGKFCKHCGTRIE